MNRFTEVFEADSRESVVFYPTVGFRTASHDFRYRPLLIHRSPNIVPRCPHCGYCWKEGRPGFWGTFCYRNIRHFRDYRTQLQLLLLLKVRRCSVVFKLRCALPNAAQNASRYSQGLAFSGVTSLKRIVICCNPD